MSWIDNLSSNLVITTGDGKEYKPLWKPSSKSVNYNIAEFEFPHVIGTRVERGTSKGRRFPLELYFQGENHLDQAGAFEASAEDKRPWSISHPYYGNIIVHPVGITFDHTDYNLSKISCTVIETITDDNPKSTVNPVEKIVDDKSLLDEVVYAAFANDVKQPGTTDINAMTSNTNAVYTLGKVIVKLPEEAEEYLNYYNDAISAIGEAASSPSEAMEAMVDLYSYPGEFTDSVTSRLDLLEDQFEKISEDVSEFTEKSRKKIYEALGIYIVSAMCVAAATPQTGDLQNRTTILSAIDKIIDTYNSFIVYLDSVKTDNGGAPESYQPDANSLMGLSKLVNLTVSSLFEITSNARQERVIYLEYDSNAINLTHRFYGLDNDDENLQEFIDNNEIALSEMLEIKKGRRLVYYV